MARFVALEVHSDVADPELIDVTAAQAALIPYVVAALAKEWRTASGDVETVQAGERDLETSLKMSENALKMH